MGSGRGGIAAVCCILLLAFLTFGVSIAELVIGAIHLHDCPAERMIPIYLIVSGAVGIFLSFGSGSDARDTHQRQQSDGEGDGESQNLRGTQALQQQSSGAKCCSFIRSLLGLFSFIWMCLGMYWVLHVRSTISDDPAAGDYCHPTLYTFALVLVFIRLALLILMSAISVCVCCGVVCCATLFA